MRHSSNEQGLPAPWEVDFAGHQGAKPWPTAKFHPSLTPACTALHSPSCHQTSVPTVPRTGAPGPKWPPWGQTCPLSQVGCGGLCGTPSCTLKSWRTSKGVVAMVTGSPKGAHVWGHGPGVSWARQALPTPNHPETGTSACAHLQLGLSPPWKAPKFKEGVSGGPQGMARVTGVCGVALPYTHSLPHMVMQTHSYMET